MVHQAIGAAEKKDALDIHHSNAMKLELLVAPVESET